MYISILGNSPEKICVPIGQKLCFYNSAETQTQHELLKQ